MESSTAGPSSNTESRDSGHSSSSSSSSSGPAAVDSFRSEPEDSQEPGQEVNVRVISDFPRNVLYMFVIVRKEHFVEKKVGIMGTSA